MFQPPRWGEMGAMSVFTERHDRMVLDPEWAAGGADVKKYRDRKVIEALAEGLTLDQAAEVFRVTRKHIERIRRETPLGVQARIERDVVEARRRKVEQLAEVG